MPGQSNPSSTINFTETDLASNRRGMISQNQIQWLKRQQAIFTYVIYLVGGSSVVIAAVGVLVGRQVGAIFTAVMIAVALFDFGLVYTLLDRFRARFREDTAQGVVERYEGEPEALWYRKRRGGLQAIKFGEEQFYTDPTSYRTLVKGGRYHAYVAPASKTLLSFERLD